MIKRRFYRVDHSDRDDAADSSSSSDSESELERQATEESEDNAVAEVKEYDQSCSTSSGYESDDGSADEINVTATSGVISEDDGEIGNNIQLVVENQLFSKRGANETKSNIKAEKESVPTDFPECVLQIKSVFRCKICPRVLCLTEGTMRAHLNSKRHARSEKLLKEHRLKAILNDDGEIENQETAAEMHARIVALAQDKPKKKDKKRRQRKRNSSRKEKVHGNLTKKKAKQSTPSPTKKRRKNEN